MPAVRRSARERRQASSVYDDAKKLVAVRKSVLAAAIRKRKDQDDEEGEESESESISDSDQTSDDDSDEDVKPVAAKPKSPVKKTPVKSPQVPKAKQAKSRKVVVKFGKKKEGGEKTVKDREGDALGIPRSRRLIQRALTVLEKKVRVLWQDQEDKAIDVDDDALVFGLLSAAKENQRGKRIGRSGDDEPMYTPQLEQIARKIINEHKSDSTRAQIKLLNLLFRSVGGSPSTDLSEENDLNLNDEEWEEAVTNLVEEMRHTPENAILLCADPLGAVHAASEDASSTPASLGVREFRKIYEEFWYVLGRVALSEGLAAKSSSAAEMDTSDDDESPALPSSSLFEVELVREIVVRMSELVTVGQPDIRAGATIAVLQLGLAALERTVELRTKLDVATRQLNASKAAKKQMKRKAEGLVLQIDSLKRSQAELEEIVGGLLFQGVFLNRYRDSNMHIRAFSLQWLSRLTILRPDLFLLDKYLKYLGWMMSDKAPCVRLASLSGLLAPFKVTKSNTGSGRNMSTRPRLDVSAMENVVKKFLPRVADCVIDVDVHVQEVAMELLLALLRAGFMEECEDDNLWTQINLRALDPTTSPSVRRGALYIITDQLDSFYVEDGALAVVSEKVKVERLDAIASWIAHELSDGRIPPEHMRIGLADLIVYSLREMPEHKELVTDWPVLLRAIKEAAESNSKTSRKDLRRIEATKQRVLLQMLACAANAEVYAVSKGDFMASDADEDVVMARAQLEANKEQLSKKKQGAQRDAELAHKSLSVALLKTLADFFVSFKGDVTVLKSLTALPRCLLPSIFSLPTHKNEFVAMIKRLSDLFLEASDDHVLDNIACSLAFFARGDHARKAEAHLQLKELTTSLNERLLELTNDNGSDTQAKVTERAILSAERKQSSASPASSQGSVSVSGSKESSAALDAEHSVSMCLKRFLVLSKRCNLADLLEIAPEDTNDGISIEHFCASVATMAKDRLVVRQIGPDSGTEPVIPASWTTGDQRIHGLVAKSVNYALSLLLSVIAWQTSISVEREQGIFEVEDDESDAPVETTNEEEVVDHVVLRIREGLVKLLQLCWEQCLEGYDVDLFSEAHINFANSVQQHACHITGDLRSLFPKEWADSLSSLLRAFALTDDGFLVGGSVRYLRSKDEEFRSRGDESGLAKNLLLPLCRGLAPNWLTGNRREAGAILSHITGSGHDSSDIVTAMSRVLKKIEPLRLLESHMACLRQSYDDWLENEPEEIEDRPTEREMQEFEEAEKRHVKMFEIMGDQADRLSKSLGVGKLSDPKLSPAVLEFVKEGIRFAFSNDDELTFGSRLYFLALIGRYAIWIRRNQSHRKIVEDFLAAREKEFREHPEFSTLLEDDEKLVAINALKEYLETKTSTKALGTPRTPVKQSVASPETEDEEMQDSRASTSPAASPVSFRRRMSHGSSVSSKRSRMSAQSSLSPLYEEDVGEDDGVDEEVTSSLPSSKRRKLTDRSRAASLGSHLSVSTVGKTQTTIEEGSGENTDDSSEKSE